MFSLNQEKMFYDAAEGLGIIINFTTGIYYSLNTAGTAVFDCLSAGANVKQIAEAFKVLPGCPENIEQKVQVYIEELCAKDILVADDNRADAVSVSEVAVSEGFELSFEEFSEVQDLIMADPIHDVNPQAGWPLMADDK